MAKKPQRQPLATIYPNRQPRRPHYLPDLMERHGVGRGDLIETLGVDKGTLSRWLDDEKPSTPSAEWAEKLGQFFGAGGDPVDIFADPHVDWLARFLRGRDEEELRRMRAMLEAAFPVKQARQ